MEDVKYCKDCKHYKPYSSLALILECHNPNLPVSIVTGEVVPIVCGDARRITTFCGIDAKWFESKPLTAEQQAQLERYCITSIDASQLVGLIDTKPRRWWEFWKDS